MPTRWMDTWRKLNPDMEYSLWTNYEGFRYQKKIHHLIEQGRYACAADIMRVEILYDHGGVYIDADSECLKPIEDAPFINDFFACKDYTDWVANGVIGSPKGHPIMKRYLEKIAGPHNYWEYGARMFTECLDETATILPTCTFYPTNWKGNKAPVEGPIYAEQHWASTKGKYETADLHR
jgi:hypothetical protein